MTNLFTPANVPLNNYPGQLSPYSNVTPFTDRDLRTFQGQLEGFIAWLNRDVIVHTDTTFETIAERLNGFTELTAEQQAVFYRDVNTALDAYHEATGADIAQYKGYFDQTKTDVLAKATLAQQAQTASEAARDKALMYSGQTAALQDAVLIARQPVQEILASRNEQMMRSIFTPARLPLFAAAVDKVKAGTADAKVLCIGDSTTAGVGSHAGGDFGQQGTPLSYPYRLASYLNGIVPVSAGLGIPQSHLTLPTNPDPRWTVLSGVWNSGPYAWGRGADWNTTENLPGVLQWTDTNVFADKFDVYYIANKGLGSVDITVTGAVPVRVSTDSQVEYPNPGSRLVRKVTITAPVASRGNVLTFSTIAGPPQNGIPMATPVHIIGVEPYQSTVSKVRIGNAGVGGSTAGNWTQDGDLFGAPGAIKAYAPDLTIISLGINDSNRPLVAADVAANVKVIADVAKLSGDVIIMSPIPSSDTSTAQNKLYEAQYNDAYKGLGYPFLDLFGRFGQPGDTFTRLLGMFNQDGLHPTSQGYSDIAAFLASGLRNIIK